jgi:pentatricopeptide repeat protein
MSYARLIDACGENRRLAEAEAVFGEMKAQRVPPDDHTYRALIKAAGRRKDVERAWELFDEMLEEYLLLPHVSTYAALISASSTVRRTHLLRRRFALKPIILPRQARDRHRKTQKEICVFRRLATRAERSRHLST